MKHMAKMVLATGLALAIVPRLARSADHQDSLATQTDPSSDIADLYSWIDDTKVVFALTVYPDAPANALFSDGVQYVIHTTHTKKLGDPETAKDILCRFTGTAPQNAQCWVGDDAYAHGDAGNTAGITSKNGKLKVFAGRRKDPFFFNLDGFKATVTTVESAGGLTFDNSGCPSISTPTSNALITALKSKPGGGAAVDHFKDLAALAIVVSVDKSLLVTDDAPILAAWASTNKAQ